MATVADIASAIGARLEGDGAIEIERARHPAEAGPADLAVATDQRHLELAAAGRARAAIVSEGADWRAAGLDAAIVAPRPRYALALVTEAFEPREGTEPGLHPTAYAHPSAEIDPSASIGPFVFVGARARIGARTRIAAQAHVGAGATIGADGVLHPGARVGRGVIIGERVVIQPNAVIGADGFSFVTPKPGAIESVEATGRVAEDMRNSRFAKIRSLGAVEIGDDVEIGACATIDAGTLAPTRIGSGTKIDNLVQIGHNVSVGSTCLICAQVGVAGSTTIGDRCVLGGQVGVGDHVSIGSDVIIGARSGVVANAADGSVLLGTPAVARDEALAIALATRRLPRLVETVRTLKKRLSEGDASR